jgi:formylglycine-generating enzyme required for sulfatase activity
VGRYQPNRLGIYDLRGNVREWVWDCAETDTGFSNFLDKLNLKEADACARRAALGTSWLDGRGSSMLGMVDYVDATAARTYIGFRLVRDLAAERARSKLNQ